MGSHSMSAVSPMSGIPTFDTTKKPRNEPNLKLRYPTGRRSKNPPTMHDFADPKTSDLLFIEEVIYNLRNSQMMCMPLFSDECRMHVLFSHVLSRRR